MARPRKDGTPGRARIPVKVGGVVKLVPDTNNNRRKYGIGGAVGSPVTAPEGATDIGVTVTPRSRTESTDASGSGPAAARAAVSGRVSDSGVDRSAERSGVSAGDAGPPIDYTIVVKTANGVISMIVPDAAMLSEEEKQIGEALDAVIAKHWPELKNAGPEFALMLAVGAYLTRVVIVPMLQNKRRRADQIDAARKAAARSTANHDAAKPSDVDPYATTVSNG